MEIINSVQFVLLFVHISISTGNINGNVVFLHYFRFIPAR